MRKSLAGIAVAVAGLGFATVAPAQAVSSPPPAVPKDGVYEVLAEDWGITPSAAKARLDAEHELANALAAAKAEIAGLDGAYFDASRRLVVNARTAEAAEIARRHGLTPRQVARGEQALTRLQQQVQAMFDRSGSKQLQSIAVDLPTDQVQVVLQPGKQSKATTVAVRQLKAVQGVHVRTSKTQLTETADVIGGQIMDLVPGTNCSLGFPGTRNGNNVLLTAGHCVEGNPDVLNRSGVHIGKGIASRFVSGSSSYDMGLMDIDAEDVGRGYIDNRNGQTTGVTGMSKAPVGTTICKAGNTTGWTCGRIQQYNVTVNYVGGTTVRGLARSTVCTEGGDSGGAYISGTTAQGMTSGGPADGHDCGWNQGHNATGSYSFYQPVVDAANYYGVSLTTS